VVTVTGGSKRRAAAPGSEERARCLRHWIVVVPWVDGVSAWRGSVDAIQVIVTINKC
jgi:hypothetical protein